MQRFTWYIHVYNVCEPSTVYQKTSTETLYFLTWCKVNKNFYFNYFKYGDLWSALSPHSQKVLGSNPSWTEDFLCGVCLLWLCVYGFSPGTLASSTVQKQACLCWLKTLNCPLVWLWEWLVAVGPVKDWRLVQAFLPPSAGAQSGKSNTVGFKEGKMMDGWKDGTCYWNEWRVTVARKQYENGDDLQRFQHVCNLRWEKPLCFLLALVPNFTQFTAISYLRQKLLLLAV